MVLKFRTNIQVSTFFLSTFGIIEAISTNLSSIACFNYSSSSHEDDFLFLQLIDFKLKWRRMRCINF